MKTLKFMLVSMILISLFSFGACRSYNYGTTETQTIYENPEWAPDYYTGVRYYYLPDIEVYYDLTMRDFIYLNNGRWMYSRVLPPMYSYYDLYSGYVILLNVNIYKPWMHHQYYVSHYPRYYYRDYYDRSNFPYVRGFNENQRSAIFWKENERNRARDWNDENLRNNRKFKYSSEDRRQQNPYNENTRRTSDNTKNSNGNISDRNSSVTNDNVNRRQEETNSTTRENRGTSDNGTGNTSRIETGARDKNRNSDTNRSGNTRNENSEAIQTNRSETTTREQPNASEKGNERRTQSTNYYGRTIGTSVKVEKQMRNPTPENTQSTNRNSSSTEGTSRSNNTNSTNRTEQNTQRR